MTPLIASSLLIRVAILILLLAGALPIAAQQDLTHYVDPFIGTGAHGHTYPGATMPFGMVQLSPDTLTHRDRVLASYLRITGGTTFVGWRRSQGWAKDQIVYFAGELSRPFDGWGISTNDEAAQSIQEANGTNVKAFFSFEPDGAPILMKVAISAVQPQQARYVRVIARNHGPIPAWHPGAGGKAWIFADEIIIE